MSAITITTRAYIADGTSAADAAVVTMGGSVRVAADEMLTLDVIAGNISASGTAAVGAAVAVPVTTKDTHAWIGNFARVSAKGDSALTVATGSYTVTPRDLAFAPWDITGGTTIHLANPHGFVNGDQVQYDKGYGDPINGLTQGGQYYVKVISATAFQLYAAATLTGSPLGLSGGTGDAHRLFKTNEANVTQNETPRFRPVNVTADATHGTVDLAGDRLRMPSGYGLGASNDDAVVYSSGGGQEIGGLIDGATYYFKDVGGGWFQLLTKKSTDGGTVVNLTGLGTGMSHSITLEGDAPSGDGAAMGPRTITAGTSGRLRYRPRLQRHRSRDSCRSHLGQHRPHLRAHRRQRPDQLWRDLRWQCR